MSGLFKSEQTRTLARQHRIAGDLMLVLFLCALSFGVVSCRNGAYTGKQQYGVRVRYTPGQKIEFPDFTLEFVGQRRVTLPQYPRGFLYYDFKINPGDSEKIVSWSSGTGDIAPAEFEMRGNHYLLELVRSDPLGSLGEDELVIWKKGGEK